MIARAPEPPAEPKYQQRYPVGNFFPLYSPLLFLLFWPFGWFDFNTSVAIYVLLNLSLAVWWISLILRGAGPVSQDGLRNSWGNMAWWGSAYLLTQSGRANFLGGETALPLTLASYGAIQLSDHRPALAGILLAITSFKPTFGLPLGIVLLAAGRWRTVLIGWGLGFVIGVAGLFLIFQQSGDLPRFVEILRDNHHALEADVDVNPHISGVRIDAVAAIETWLPRIAGLELLAPWLVLLVAVVGIVRLRQRPIISPAEQLVTREVVAAICAIAVVAGMYHLLYDGLLIYAVLAWLILSPASMWEASPRWLRPTLIALVTFPLVNYFTTQAMQTIYLKVGLSSPPFPAKLAQITWTCICSANGIALFTAMALLAWWPRARRFTTN